MSGFSPLTRAQFRAIAVNQFQASLIASGLTLEQIPDTGPDSVMGAVCDAASAVAEQIQYQATQYQLASRLLTTPANPDGSVSADAASYAAPFNIIPASGASATSQTFQLNLSSLSPNPTTVACGLIIQRNDGVQYVVIADSTQADYNGSQGYTVPANTPFLTVTGMCLTAGSVGNVSNPAAATWSVYAGPGSIIAPSVSTITNTSVISNGSGAESQVEFVARFTLAMQNGQWGVESAIIAKALGVQTGLTVSYGDHINADGSYHAAYFTLVVNVVGSSTVPSSLLITNVTTAISKVRSGGIEYQVIAPTLITPALSGNIAVYSSFSKSTVLLAVQTAVQNYINSIGLNQAGGSTTLSYAQTLALMIGVAGVNPIGTTLLINLSTLDVSAPFGSQIVAPAFAPFTTS